MTKCSLKEYFKLKDRHTHTHTHIFRVRKRCVCMSHLYYLHLCHVEGSTHISMQYPGILFLSLSQAHTHILTHEHRQTHTHSHVHTHILTHAPPPPKNTRSALQG